VSGVAALVRAEHPGFTYLQTINQILSTVEPLQSLQGITVTGGELSAAAALGVVPAARVFDGSTAVIAATSTVDFGQTTTGVPLTKTFTVKNVGGGTLLLTSQPTVPAGYTLAAPFGSTTLAPGASTTFQVQLTAASQGTFSGIVSFGTNDTTKNPFTFTVTGLVADARIVDDKDAGFSTTAGWTFFAGQGFRNSDQYAAAGTGAAVASWTFTGLTPGQYQVSATWVPYPNRASNAPYTVRDGSTAVGQVTENQLVPPSDFSDVGVAWQNLGGPCFITGTTLTVQLSNNANGFVIADAIRVRQVGSLPATKEIEVLDGPNNLPSGGTSSFGNTAVGSPVMHTYTVRNVGGTTLTLGAINPAPSGFSIAGYSPTTLAPGATTSFQVTLTALSAGSFSGPISFANDDDDNGDGVENPFTFTVSGTVTASAILDNSDPGFSTVGSWFFATGQGFKNNVSYAAAGNGTTIANWIFTVTPGVYQVSATWTPYPNRANNAPYTTRDGGTPVSLLTVNQQNAPVGFSDGGATWQNLDGTVNITSSTLVVQLSNNANGFVIADAIRIQRVGNLPATKEIEVLDGPNNLPNGGTSAFGNTTVGTPVTRTYTIRNVGGTALTLGALGPVPSGFSVMGYSPTTLAPGATTSFQVTLTAAATGSPSGSISFTNNDDDNGDGVENPFSFTVNGTVSNTPQFIDNSMAGFSTVGSWTFFTGQGYLNNVSYAAAGTGTSVASWTFTGLAAGMYQVSATWTPYPNRATNAPYTVLADGSTTVLVNQQNAPNPDFTDFGFNWQNLGAPVTVSGTSLVVQLSNNANGFVIADAIRIVKL
jgi:hypothetical protein